MKNRLTPLSRVLLAIAAVLLVIVLFVPIWRIELDAPQYPEGLVLQIYADSLGGNVEVINGLNHYIGMKELHTDDFVEFAVLPYIIGAFAFFFVLSAIVGRKRWLYASFFSFLLFGIVAMVDFYIWEYNYGHNLDPNAAIQVPGMTYQPPLIGFKQLLNFGAYSVPDLGGWLFVAAGLLLLLGLVKEMRKSGNRKWYRFSAMMGIVASSQFIGGCGETKPEPIALNKDMCAFCRMAISDGRFGAELITTKGRIYKFDDLVCMLGYEKQQENTPIRSYYINDYNADNILIDATTAVYIHHEDLKSPMRGNIAAFSDNQQAMKYAGELSAPVLSWDEINTNQNENGTAELH